MNLRLLGLAVLPALLSGVTAARPAAQANQTAPVTDPSSHRVGMVTVDGVRVPYLDWGGRGPGLVFVAGLGNSAHVFDDFAPRFTDRFRVLGVTRTGFGESDQPERDGYDLGARVAHVLAAVDAAGITKVVLVGHSLGGDEITAFAVAHSDRTSAVIYLDAAMDHAATLKRVGDLSPLLPQPPDITAEERSSAPAFREYYRRTTSLEYPIGEVLALTIPGRSGLLNTRTQSRVITAIMNATVPPEFARVRAPMLALCSESTAADAFPWLASGSPDHARASALFGERLRAHAARGAGPVHAYSAGGPGIRLSSPSLLVPQSSRGDGAPYARLSDDARRAVVESALGLLPFWPAP